MNAPDVAMTVIGAGSYGTALAITLARNGHKVVLWGHDPQHIARLQQDRCNAAFLPAVPFPDTLQLEQDLAAALAASHNILLVVPSHVFAEVLRQIKPLMRPDTRLAWATKGLEAETGCLLQDVAREILGKTLPLAVISGKLLPKNWRQDYRRPFHWHRQSRSLLVICSNFCIVTKIFASISIRILLVCSWVAQ